MRRGKLLFAQPLDGNLWSTKEGYLGRRSSLREEKVQGEGGVCTVEGGNRYVTCKDCNM